MKAGGGGGHPAVAADQMRGRCAYRTDLFLERACGRDIRTSVRILLCMYEKGKEIDDLLLLLLERQKQCTI